MTDKGARGRALWAGDPALYKQDEQVMESKAVSSVRLPSLPQSLPPGACLGFLLRLASKINCKL